MAPPCQAFPVSKLELHVQVGPDQKVRKTETGRRIDLAKDCELSEMFQYDCVVANPALRDSPVECWPVRRFFRT
ncbi:hypothetical protein QBC35DRAFT_492726 [Podospora australis]|uniref:Uncharacterized protein n=1 Tax=Podospora australis TaxID=1536484 RepID=A0AAN6WWH6_9PEZI|nr:hypothetical protein QBC35DRAFT_492726 [Podospora australis]